MKLIKLLSYLLTTFIVINNYSFCQSNEQFSHFPLTVGNKWFFSWVPTIDNSVRTILEATSDTLMSDGKLYTRIDKFDKEDSNWTRTEGYYYLREEHEILYNFPSDTLLNYNWNDSTSWDELPDGFTEVHIDSLKLFNKKRLTFFVYIFYPYEYISYTDSIGFNALHALEWRDWAESSRYLIGCTINNRTYGTIITSISSDESKISLDYRLDQNYPNPFNPSTKIRYSLSHSGKVTLKLFNSIGEELLTLVNEYQPSGKFEIILNMNDYTSGVYFYRLNVDNFTQSKKLLYLK